MIVLERSAIDDAAFERSAGGDAWDGGSPTRDAAFARSARVRQALVRGRPIGNENYELDVPGATEPLQTGLVGVVAQRPDRSRIRVTTALGIRDGTLFSLHVRGPVTDGGADPRRIAATLRLDR